MEILEIKRISKEALLPVRQTAQAAGYDLSAFLTEDIVLAPGERKLIPTGIMMAIPEGLEGQIRPRSGLAIKHGIGLLNSPGTIDADYRGEVKIIMINHGQEDFTVTNKMRIAQIVFSKVISLDIIEKEQLSTTNRGEGGFGHSGTH